MGKEVDSEEIRLLSCDDVDDKGRGGKIVFCFQYT